MNETKTWYELQWGLFAHVETELSEIESTLTSLLRSSDRPLTFRFEKRVSSSNAYERAVKDQRRKAP